MLKSLKNAHKMVMNQLLVISDLPVLCFLNCKFHKLARTDLTAILVNFYSLDEIIAAKKLFFTLLSP